MSITTLANKSIWKYRFTTRDESIWKYPFTTRDGFTIDMPEGAKILSLQVQRNYPCMWVLVDPGSKIVTRWFRVFGTGHDASSLGDDSTFIGTYQIHGGDLVFHVFEVSEPKIGDD